MNALASYDDKLAWLTWKNTDGRKVPYAINGGAYHRKRLERGTRREAELSKKKRGKDGIGIAIGIKTGGLILAGIDLDTCLEDGTLTPWARKIVDLFKTYTEVSPSGTGVKLFFLIRVEDLPALLSAIGKTADGQQ
jgi:putative DNA primase/helicase